MSMVSFQVMYNEKIYLEEESVCTKKIIENLMIIGPNISSLDISQTDISDKGLYFITQLCPRLISLNLSLCTNVTDEGLIFLGRKLSFLAELNIIWCKNVSDIGLNALGNLTSLNTLGVGYCSKITDAGVKAIIGKLTGLTWLNMTWCSQISDRGMGLIASNLSNLTHLNIRGCIKISDVSLENFTRLKCLNLLDIRNCDAVTNNGIYHLVKDLPYLTLKINGCEKLDWPLIKQLALNYPDIQFK